jgi:hypothetical protein
MSLFAVKGNVSGELLSYGGQVLVHNDRAEMEWLLPGSRIVPLPPSIPIEQRLPLRFHPELAHLSWPLRREEFQ